MVAMIIKYFRTWPTRTGGPHRPEIIIGSDANNPVVRQARMFFPNIHRFFVSMIDCDQKLVRIDAKLFGNQIPSKGNCIFLEVVPKAEIPKHFEKSMVTRSIANIVQIVMLAARANAFLAADRTAIIALLKAGKDVFELNHPGGGKHQSWIIAGHQRRAIDDLMAVFLKVIKEG